MRIALIILASLAAIILALGYALSVFSTSIKRQSLDEARAWQAEHYDISWYDRIEKTDYTVKSGDGYVLHAQFLKNPAAEGGRYVLLTHGYTDNRFGSLKYVQCYFRLGFNAVIYDLRGHGLNEKTFCSYTVRESGDLEAMISDTLARYPDCALLGLHGESLGASTTAAVMKDRPKVAFAVADCGFAEIAPVMKNGLRGMHIPTALLYVAWPWTKLRLGYGYGAMRPIEALRDNEIPMLFIHGGADDFTFPWHSEAMSQATKGPGELFIVPGAGHAGSVLTDPEGYYERVEGFLKKNGLI